MTESHWYATARLDTECTNHNGGVRCHDCDPDGFCDSCDTFEGRFIEAIQQYATTCDGCGELTHHDLQISDPEDETLGYCETCRPEWFAEWRASMMNDSN